MASLGYQKQTHTKPNQQENKFLSKQTKNKRKTFAAAFSAGSGSRELGPPIFLSERGTQGREEFLVFSSLPSPQRRVTGVCLRGQPQLRSRVQWYHLPPRASWRPSSQRLGLPKTGQVSFGEMVGGLGERAKPCCSFTSHCSFNGLDVTAPSLPRPGDFPGTFSLSNYIFSTKEDLTTPS